MLPRVYAVGHRAPSRGADLWAAVLYAGPGAAISHRTAAQWYGLIDLAPSGVIEVTTPRKVGSIRGVRVHGRCGDVRRSFCKGIPVVDLAQALLGLAETAEPRLLRRALSVLDFRGELDFAVIEAACGRGRAGSAALRRALAEHDPRLAYANGRLEEDFLELCRRWGLPSPQVNVRVQGILVDAYWPAARLVVELDGVANHSSAAQLRRDHQNELTLRAHGLEVRRYDWVLLRERGELVRLELSRALL